VVNMNDIYVLKNGMTKEQMFRLRLINGFNFSPIVADAIVDLRACLKII